MDLYQNQSQKIATAVRHNLATWHQGCGIVPNEGSNTFSKAVLLNNQTAG